MQLVATHKYKHENLGYNRVSTPSLLTPCSVCLFVCMYKKSICLLIIFLEPSISILLREMGIDLLPYMRYDEELSGKSLLLRVILSSSR